MRGLKLSIPLAFSLCLATPAWAIDNAGSVVGMLGKTKATCGKTASAQVDEEDLMKMTRLTCGLIEVNTRLKRLKATLGAEVVMITERDNRLLLQASSINGLFATPENCKNVIDAVRYDAGVDSRKGWLLTDYASRYTTFLLGEGPRTATRATHEKTLDDSFVIAATLVFNDQKVTCSGKLLGTGVALP